MTLFEMMNGDSLHNHIGAARWRGGEGLWGALTLAYFFSYIALAIYVVRASLVKCTAHSHVSPPFSHLT